MWNNICFGLSIKGKFHDRRKTKATKECLMWIFEKFIFDQCQMNEKAAFLCVILFIQLRISFLFVQSAFMEKILSNRTKKNHSIGRWYANKSQPLKASILFILIFSNEIPSESSKCEYWSLQSDSKPFDTFYPTLSNCKNEQSIVLHHMVVCTNRHMSLGSFVNGNAMLPIHRNFVEMCRYIECNKLQCIQLTAAAAAVPCGFSAWWHFIELIFATLSSLFHSQQHRRIQWKLFYENWHESQTHHHIHISFIRITKTFQVIKCK